METKNYFNNSKVANTMVRVGILEDYFEVKELGDKKEHVRSLITLEADDIQELNLNVSRFDLMVMDSVYTLLTNGVNRFSLEAIANTIAGKEVSLDKNTSKKLQEIQTSLNKLRRICINIDYTDIMREKKAIKDNERFVVNGYLMPLTIYHVISPVKRRDKIVYELDRKPVLYEYAENLGRIVSVPSSVLTLPGVREDTDFIMIKQELVKEIELMKKEKNRYKTTKIIYEWDRGEQKGGFAARVGLFEENYANSTQWRKRKVKLTEQIKTILTRFVEIGYIKGFELIKKDKSVIGVTIVL